LCHIEHAPGPHAAGTAREMLKFDLEKQSILYKEDFIK